MRVLITGVSGFVGRHLAEALNGRGVETVHGASREPTQVHLQPGVQLHAYDPLHPTKTLHLLHSVEPQWIFHLAGYANNGMSFREPDKAWQGNLDATRVLLDACARWGGRPRVLLASTGLVYGDPVKPGEVFTEDAPLRPASPYAVSKAAADLLGYQAWKEHGLEVIRIRQFNQIGPGMLADYAIPNFARQIAEIELKRQEPLLETGDLTGERDFTDVRDMMEAYIGLMEKGQAGEAYNCATGTTYSMRAMLDRMLEQAFEKIEVREKVDESRRHETHVSRACVDKLKAATGWQPTRTLEKTLGDVLYDWRLRARGPDMIA